MNGNNFITTQEITPATFAGKLSRVVIAGDAEADMAGLIGEHRNMELAQIQKHDNEFWFILRELSASELERLQLRADIDFALMLGGASF